MMIHPTPGALLQRIAETLERSALNDMGSSLAHRQLKAGLWALRDIAGRLDARADVIRADIEDMRATLTATGWKAEFGPLPNALGDAELHLRLQAQLEALETRQYASSPDSGDALRLLRALHQRMLERGTAQIRRD